MWFGASCTQVEALARWVEIMTLAIAFWPQATIVPDRQTTDRRQTDSTLPIPTHALHVTSRQKDIDTLKGPFTILEDDKLFHDSMYRKSYFLPKCNTQPKHTNTSMEEEREYKTFFTRIFLLLLK